VEEVTEELIPEEHEACGEGGLQQAGGQALEEALGAFLLQHLLGTIQEAIIAPHLGRGRLLKCTQSITAPNKYMLDEGMTAK
jgi:hypothetical protein